MSRSASVEAFYVSWTWRKCRQKFAEKRGHLCERCLAHGIIQPGTKDRPLEVHHKIPLTDQNLNDPNVALNWDNLELLCKDCHEKEKGRKQQKRYTILPDGSVKIAPPGRT